MDDDELRRGRPTVHVAYDEALAILAVTRAHGGVSARGGGRDARRSERALAITRVLAGRGGRGRNGGWPVADLEAEGAIADHGLVESIHRPKPPRSSPRRSRSARSRAVRRSNVVPRSRDGRALGLAFQVADDVLDAVARPGVTGSAPAATRRSAS